MSRSPIAKKPGPKLTPAQVARLRAAHADGVTWEALSKRFAVSERVLREVVREGAAS